MKTFRSTQIKNLNDAGPIISALKYAFAVVGVRNNEIPDNIQTQLLVNLLKDHFKYLGIEEIRTAFDFLVAGQLDLPQKDCSPYGSFNCLYLGKVLNSYKRKRDPAMIEINIEEQKNKKDVPYIPNTIEKEKIALEFVENVVLPMYLKFKEFNKLDLGAVQPKLVYDVIVENRKYIEFTKEDKKDIVKQAAENLEKKKQEIIEMKAVNYNQHKLKLQIMSEFADINKNSDEIKTECYKIGIIRAFNRMIYNKIDKF